MLHISISLRALVFGLLLAAMALTGSDVAKAGPAAAIHIDDNFIQFQTTGLNFAHDINVAGNQAGLRFYGCPALADPNPQCAAIQFFGDGSTNFPGQLFLDTGSNPQAAIRFRTPEGGGEVTERMRVAANGNVGIGTNDPQSPLHVNGDIRTSGNILGTVNADIAALTNNIGVVTLSTTTGNVQTERLRVENDGRVRAGDVDSDDCNGAGDICAGDALVADGDVKAGGNGALKAGVHVGCANAGSAIVASFNNVNATVITVADGPVAGQCTVDFGFDVTNRFIVATPAHDGAVGRAVAIHSLAGNTVTFFRTDMAGTGINGRIYVAVY
jgi:hypothetical protein